MLAVSHLPMSVVVPTDHWHDVLWRSCTPDTWAFDGLVHTCCVGPVRISTSQLGGTDTEWHAHDVDRDADGIALVWMQRDGEAAVRQAGNEAALAAGDYVIIDAGAPFRITTSPDSRNRLFRVPKATLGLSSRTLDAVAGVAVRGDTCPGRVSSRLLEVIGNEAADIGGAAGEAVVAHALASVRVVADDLAAGADLDADLADDGAALRNRVLAHIDANLSDAGLSVVGIARAHHVSVRTLQKVFALTGDTVGDTVRQRRLDAIRRELAAPQSRSRTIAAVARAYGYPEPAHFSRSFRRAYGISPRSWRALAARTAA